MIPLGAAIGLMTTWSPTADAGDIAADLDNLARRLVAERHAAVMAGHTAHRDEKRVGTADSACPDLDQHIGRTDRRLRRVDHLCLTGRGHDRHLHLLLLYAGSWL